MNRQLIIRRAAGFIGLALLIALTACEKDIDPENPGIINGQNFDADELGEMLALENALKITGAPPEAPDMQLKINVKDTIYLMQGLARGARLIVRHDGLHEITGFFIGVESSSFYFDVPVIEDMQDSVSTVFINLGDTHGLDWDFSFPVFVIPHADGIPWDKFIKVVKAEKPVDPEEDEGCSITVPAPEDTSVFVYNGAWIWDFTLFVNLRDTTMFHFEAAGRKLVSAYTTGGCCNEDSSSSTVADDPYCYEKHSGGEPNERWRSLDVNHYFVWVYDIVVFFDNGRFVQDNLSMQTNYKPSQTDFCNGVPGYEFDKSFYSKWGSHDFTPGADYLTISYDPTDPPVWGKTIPSAKIIYNCHYLQFMLEVEEQLVTIVFRRYQEPLKLDGSEVETGGVIYN